MLIQRFNKPRFCGKCGKYTMKVTGHDNEHKPIWRCKCGFTHIDNKLTDWTGEESKC